MQTHPTPWGGFFSSQFSGDNDQMEWLRVLVGIILPSFRTQPPKVSLPREILDALAQKDPGPVVAWMQARLNADPNSPEFDLLIETARQSGWSDFDADKLEAIGHLSAGRNIDAHRIASQYLGDMKFDPGLFFVAASALFNIARFEDAYALLTSAQSHGAIVEEWADCAMIASKICWSMNRSEEARHHLDTARQLAPEDKLIALIAHNIYFETADMQAFEQVSRELNENKYTVNATGFTLPYVEFARDNYEEGFRLAEARVYLPEAVYFLNKGLFDRPRWQGENLEGKTLIVSAEQGLGDTVQMARYFPQLNGMDAECIIVETQPETLTLLEFNFPNVTFIKRKLGESPSVEFDLWTGMMSLPHLFGITAQNIPGRTGYLRVPPDVGAYWRDRVAELAPDNRLRIGIAWSGNPVHTADRRRSIPFSRMMDAIRDINAVFFAVQTHVPSVHPANLIDVSEEMVTLADTAALIDKMDIVITVDTSVVHVAGSIGKETWLLLPYRYEWRWSLEGEGNNWYDSVRVLRQKAHGHWDDVLTDAFGPRLEAFISAKQGKAE